MTLDTSSDAFEDELLSHQGFLRRLALQLARDEHAADDLVQRTLLYALENPPATTGRLRGWLRTVMRRTAIRFLATERRRWEREARVAREEATGEGAETVQAEDWLACQGALLEALRSLPESYRGVVYLRYFEGLTPTQIAVRTGLPQQTVKTRLRRARVRLRETLSRGRKDRLWTLALLAVPGPPPVTAVAAPPELVPRPLLVGLACVAIVALPFVLGHGPRERSELVLPAVATTGEDAPVLVVPVESSGSLGAGRAATAVSSERPMPVEQDTSSFLCRAVTEEGDPVAGLTVIFRESELDRLQEGRPVGVTDQEGRVQLDAIDRPGRLYALDEEWDTVFEPILTRFTAGREYTAIVAPIRRVASRVVDEDGLPVDRALVAKRDPTWGVRADVSSCGNRPISVLTSLTGDFSFEAPLLRSTRVIIRKPGYRTELFDAFDLPDPIVLSAHEGGISGMVLDPFGSALEGVEVAVGFGLTHSDRDGHFEIPESSIRGERLPLGAAGCTAERLVATHPDYRPVRFELGELGAAPFEIQFVDAPLSISGRVVDDEGEAAVGTQVWLHDPTFLSTPHEGTRFDTPYGQGLELGSREPVTTDDQGWFEISGLADREYTLRALDLPGRRTATTDPIPAGTSRLEVELQPFERTVSGRVVDPSGAPCTEVQIRFMVDVQVPRDVGDGLGHRWRRVARVHADADGRFRVDAVPHGAYPLVLGDGYWATAFREDAAVRTQLDEGEGPVDLELVVPRANMFRVRLNDLDAADRAVLIRACDEEPLPLRQRQLAIAILGDFGYERTSFTLSSESPLLIAPAGADTLVLYRDKLEVARLPLEFESSGEVLEVEF